MGKSFFSSSPLSGISHKRAQNPKNLSKYFLEVEELLMIEQKGMTFDHDFGYSIPIFSFLEKKEGRRKRE